VQSLARRPAGAKLATDAANWIIPMTIVIKGPSLPRLARPLDVESLLQFITGVRTFFRVLGVAVGISTSLSSGHAEIEEYDSHNKSVVNYTGYAFTDDEIITLGSNKNTAFVIQLHKKYELYNTLYDDGNFNASTATRQDSSGRPTHGDDIRDDLIPSTVWGLEVSNGARFDPNYNDLMTIIGSDSAGVLADNTDAGGVGSLFQEIVERFRGANCDVELFESHDLNHCDVNDHSADIFDISTPIANVNDNNDASTTLKTERSYYSGPSNQTLVTVEITQGTSKSIQGLYARENSLDTVHDLSTLVGAGINAFALQGHLTDRSIARDPCYDDDNDVVGVDTSMSCQTSPITRFTPDPSEPVSLPIVTRPRVTSAVPEMSTWIMFTIGFTVITLVRWKRKLNYEDRYRVLIKMANKIFLTHY
jgi:hypothetical protein